MMNIAILDNDILWTQKLKNYLIKWSLKHNIILNIMPYQTGTTLLNSNFHENNITFIDIELPDISGLEVAKQLRQLSYKGRIIFLITHKKYIFDGYHMHAFDFLIKPITYKILEASMFSIVCELKASYYILQTKSTIEKIPYKTIIAFSTEGHYINIITTQMNYCQKSSLKSIQALLPENFIQCHRTFIVNIEHILKIEKMNFI